jgi:hypothetical protein
MKPTALEVRSLGELARSDHFFFMISNPKVEGMNRNMFIKCNRIDNPGSEVGTLTVNLFGHQVKHPTKRVSSQQISATFYDDQSLSVSKALETWRDLTKSTKTGNGQIDKEFYCSDGNIFIFNSLGFVSNTITIKNMFIERIDYEPLSGENTSLYQISVTFGYDYKTTDYDSDFIGSALGRIFDTGVGKLVGKLAEKTGLSTSFINNIGGGIARNLGLSNLSAGILGETGGLLNSISDSASSLITNTVQNPSSFAQNLGSFGRESGGFLTQSFNSVSSQVGGFSSNLFDRGKTAFGGIGSSIANELKSSTRNKITSSSFFGGLF